MAIVTVKRLRNGAGVEFYAATEPNSDSFYSQFTAAQVERNPAKFHIVESSTAESILRESFHEHKLGPSWVKVKPVTSFREASGSPERKRLGSVTSLEQRGFTKSAAGQWSRNDVTITLNPDGSWRCGKDSGKDAHTLNTYLDTVAPQPQESFRARLTEAFRLTGMSEREALIASGENEDVLLDAWDLVMGSREAGKLARENKPRVDPREMELLRMLGGKR